MDEREQISALVDGELAPAEREALLVRLEREPALAEAWRRHHLLRAALQHEAPTATDLSARVMTALASEPALHAPAALPAAANEPVWWRQTWLRVAGGMAVAATVTFGLMSVLQPAALPEAGRDLTAIYRAGDRPAVLVESETGAATAKPEQVAMLDDSAREDAYLLAHAEYSGRGLQSGMTSFARMAGQDDDL